MMRRLMNVLMLSCIKVTELIEKRQVVSLSTMEKVQMNLHISMCKACKAYQQQSGFIDKALSRLQTKSKDTSQELSTDIKKKIVEGLQDN